MRQLRKVVIVLPLILLLTACAAMQLHPGSVNKADSSAYDVLLIAQAVIDQSRAEVTAGTLPENLKPGLMKLIDSYNVARMSWLTYRNAVKAGQSANASILNAAINTLSNALNTFQNSRSIIQ
jgi:hypothetical protein